jgi:hypothetical protein
MNNPELLEIRLSVYRRLDDRAEGLDARSPYALELHDRRKAALHEALDGVPEWEVTDWGYTDDNKPHELVDLVIAIVSSPHFQAAAASAIT